MKLTAWIAAAMIMVSMCVAQEHKVAQIPELAEFAARCGGVGEVSRESGFWLKRSRSGEWASFTLDRPPDESSTDAFAIAWHRSNWMVDIEENLDEGKELLPSRHTGIFCFDGQGQVLYMTDYFLGTQCHCLRVGRLSFTPEGRIDKREVEITSLETGRDMREPEQSGALPEIWGFRRLNQLPFYSLLKK